MKRLILMRHAKSSWKDTTLPDHDRPLNKRGRASAKAMGDWLREQNWHPDAALVSTSTRTRETWDLLNLNLTPSYRKDLYHADPRGLFDILTQAKADTVLLLGHNTGIGMFAHSLLYSPPKHPRFADYPTAATTLITFDIRSWAALQPYSGAAKGFAIPRELMAP